MLFKQTTLYMICVLSLIQTLSIHGVDLFGYSFNVTSRLSAWYSHVQNYRNQETANPPNEEHNTLDSAPILVQRCVDGFPHMCDNLSGWCAIQAILLLYPNTAQVFVQPAINNFSRMYGSLVGGMILRTILQYYPQAIQTFAKAAGENFSQIHDPVILDASILKEILAHPDTTDLFIKHLKNDPGSFYPFTDLSGKKTQTTQHLISHLVKKYGDLSSRGRINYQDDNNLHAMTKAVIDLEHQEQQKGRYTFVHAHQWCYHFYQELYTDLWSIVNENPSNYRFVRYTYPIKPSIEAFFSYIEHHQKVRQKLVTGNFSWYQKLEAVNDSGYYVKKGYQKYLLFINYALFANEDLGMNSAFYIKNSISENPIQIDCMQFIQELGLDHYLTQSEIDNIRNKFKKLEQEHTTLSNYGSGILLSFTPKLMAESVYLCKSSGLKDTAKIKGLGRTSDPRVILDTLRTNPEKIVPPYPLCWPHSDYIEFACVLSHDIERPF